MKQCLIFIYHLILLLFLHCQRWAELQCDHAVIDKTGENIRDILDDVLNVIRFPVMSLQDFEKKISPMNVLTKEETCLLLKYLKEPDEK